MSWDASLMLVYGRLTLVCYDFGFNKIRPIGLLDNKHGVHCGGALPRGAVPHNLTSPHFLLP